MHNFDYFVFNELFPGTLRGILEVEKQAKLKGETVSMSSGYKRELMRIVANMCYHNQRNQDEVSKLFASSSSLLPSFPPRAFDFSRLLNLQVRELGGIEIVLNHCNIDDNNPCMYYTINYHRLCRTDLIHTQLFENGLSSLSAIC